MSVIDFHWQLYNTLNQVSFNAGQKLQMNIRYIEWWNMKSINPLDPKTMYLQKQWFPAHEQWTYIQTFKHSNIKKYISFIS